MPNHASKPAAVASPSRGASLSKKFYNVSALVYLQYIAAVQLLLKRRKPIPEYLKVLAHSFLVLRERRGTEAIVLNQRLYHGKCVVGLGFRFTTKPSPPIDFTSACAKANMSLYSDYVV